MINFVYLKDCDEINLLERWFYFLNNITKKKVVILINKYLYAYSRLFFFD